MDMKVSIEGLKEIVSHEAIVLDPYKDSVGVWTIWVGHTAAAGGVDPKGLIGKETTIGQALDQFKKDIEKFERRVRKAFGNTKLTQPQFDAAVSFDYNTGGIHKASWVKKFKAGDVAGAKRSFMSWRKPAAIIPRRKKERDLFFSGTYSNDGYASIYPATRSGRVQWSKGKRVNISNFLNDGAGNAPAKEIPSLKAIPMQKPENDNFPSNRKNGLGPVVATGGGLIALGIASWWDALKDWFWGGFS